MTMEHEFPERRILSVSELTFLIKGALEAEFAGVWVEGEVSNVRVPNSGHIYLTLKDEASQIKAVIFRSSGRFLKFQLQDGLQVICHGRLNVYEVKGEYQIIIDYIEPKGIGALQLAFEQLKERLRKEGLFDEAHKRPIPILPRRIGIITSPTGAVIRDILSIIDRRFANVETLIYPVTVQGDRAAGEIIEAINDMNRMEEVDVLILARGGGSLEDLWPFNEEAVARAISASKIPVISAIGHETDFTIADFVADLRAPTPSAAAELVVQNKEDLLHKIESWETRLINVMRRDIELLRSLLKGLIKGLIDPTKKICDYYQRIDDLSFRLSTHMNLILKANRERASLLFGKLDTLSPLAILARGYSIVRKPPSMAIIKNTKGINKGDSINIRLHKGELNCLVEEVKG